MEKIIDINNKPEENIDFLNYKIEKLELQLQNALKDKELAELKLNEALHYNWKGAIPPLIDAIELAEYFNLSESAARQLMNSKNFPMIRTGKRYYAITEAVLDYLKKRKGQDVLDNKY